MEIINCKDKLTQQKKLSAFDLVSATITIVAGSRMLDLLSTAKPSDFLVLIK